MTSGAGGAESPLERAQRKVNEIQQALDDWGETGVVPATFTRLREEYEPYLKEKLDRWTAERNSLRGGTFSAIARGARNGLDKLITN